MSALMLRLIACICMLSDHIGYCLHIDVLRYIGRLAFPIYVFLMINGFFHTRSRVKYAGRLALFAVLSQIPFALFCQNTVYYYTMNVMVTLLLGLLVVWAGETLRQNRHLRYFSLLPALFVFALCHFGKINSDYDSKGILLAVVFWLFRDKPLWMAVGAILSIWHRNILFFLSDMISGNTPAVPSRWELTQNFSLLSLPLIWLYNGKPGTLPQNPTAKRAVQLGFYAFYPLHMLILWFLFVR